MNALALQQLHQDAHLADTRHSLRVITAQKEAQQNPPKWDIGDHTPVGVIKHHWLDQGVWWYHLGSLHTATVHELSQPTLVALIDQNRAHFAPDTITFPSTRGQCFRLQCQRQPVSQLTICIEKLIRNEATGGSRLEYQSLPLTQLRSLPPAWVDQMNATLQYLNNEKTGGTAPAS